MALPRQLRLRSPRSFSKVYRQLRRGSGRSFAIKALKNPSPDDCLPGERSSGVCIGVSISRKVHKRAVVRNRVKRQIHTALKTLLPRAVGDWWLVVNVRTTAITCEYYEILQELEEVLVKLEVLDGN